MALLTRSAPLGFVIRFALPARSLGLLLQLAQARHLGSTRRRFLFFIAPRFLFGLLAQRALFKHPFLGLAFDALTLGGMLGNGARRDFTGLGFAQGFLLGLPARTALGFQFDLALALGFFTQFLLDQRLCARANGRFLFGRQSGRHFGFDACTLFGFFACPRLQAQTLRPGLRFHQCTRFLLGLQARGQFRRCFCRRCRLLLVHAWRLGFGTFLFLADHGDAQLHLRTDFGLLLGQHTLGIDLGPILGLGFCAGQRIALLRQTLLKHAARVFLGALQHRRLNLAARTFLDVALQHGFHLGPHLRFDFRLELLAQVALGRLEFLVLFLCRDIRLRARLCQGLGLRLRPGPRRRQGLRLRFRLGPCRRQHLLLLGLFRQLLLRHPRVCIQLGFALFLFGSHLRLELGAGAFRGFLRAFGLFHGAH